MCGVRGEGCRMWGDKTRWLNNDIHTTIFLRVRGTGVYPRQFCLCRAHCRYGEAGAGLGS